MRRIKWNFGNSQKFDSVIIILSKSAQSFLSEPFISLGFDFTSCHEDGMIHFSKYTLAVSFMENILLFKSTQNLYHY